MTHEPNGVQHGFYARPSAHRPWLVTRAGLGTISRSSGIVRFVQGGVVKTFRCMPQVIRYVTYAAYTLFAFGCFVCLFNFYLSFLRYPLFRLGGGARDDYRWSSGVPMIGSLLVAAFAFFVLGTPWLFWFGILSAILDSGGLHWFAGTMIYMFVRGDA